MGITFKISKLIVKLSKRPLGDTTRPMCGQTCINLYCNLFNSILLIYKINLLYFISVAIHSIKITNTILIDKSIKLMTNLKYLNSPSPFVFEVNCPTIKFFYQMKIHFHILIHHEGDTTNHSP